MKIIYFDYWTRGVHNFVPIDEDLKKKGHETLLLHIGSFRFTHPKEEVISNILCRDILYYDTILIYKALLIEKPDVVITLNTTNIMDRALVFACRVLKIKTVFIMHGIHATRDEELESTLESMKGWLSFSDKIAKGKKYFRQVLPNYFWGMYKDNWKKIVKLKWLQVLIHNFQQPGMAMYYPLHSAELIQDKCLIYAKKYVSYYTELGYPLSSIKLVGNPAYESLFEKIEKQLFSFDELPIEIKNLVAEGQAYAVYLEGGLHVQNINQWDIPYLKTELLDLADFFMKKGIKLIVKLHPVTKKEILAIEHPNVLVYEKLDLYSLVFFSKLCIGHLSTTMNIPVLLKKPILVPIYGRSKDLPDYFIKNNVATSFQISDDELILEINQSARDIYIQESISVLKPGIISNITESILT